MYYSNMLLIADNNGDAMFIVFAIIVCLLVFYAIGFAKLAEKREEKLREAKAIAVEMLDVRNSRKDGSR